MKTIRIKIEGKVQGVFYRQAAKEKAVELGIKGTVKNCEDESVEVVVTGDELQLKQFTDWCREGPPRSAVTNLVIEKLPLQQFRNFSILYF